VPETEVYDESADRAIIAVDDVIEPVGATQPPTPAQMPILSPIPIRDTPPGFRGPVPLRAYMKDTQKPGILYLYWYLDHW